MRRSYVAPYEALLAYEKARDFPGAMIERTDIVQCWFNLRRASAETRSDKNVIETMARNWGADCSKVTTMSRNLPRTIRADPYLRVTGIV